MYICNACGSQYKKWQGQCTNCKEWNELQDAPDIIKSAKQNQSIKGIKPQILADVQVSNTIRFNSGINEVDRVLGGGFVTGSVVLLGGQPGAGKSTLILQILAKLSAKMPVIYITGEESIQQIALRSKRMQLDDANLPVLAATDIDEITTLLATSKPKIVVIDSIQMMAKRDIASPAGSVSQVRSCTNMLIEVAKKLNICILLIGHVTKDGSLAGPKVLEHCVDVSLVLDTMTDSRYRSLRVYKNRYGAIDELGIFAMTNLGMKPVSNPSALFLSGSPNLTAGSVTTVVREGSLPLLLEVQALASSNAGGHNRQVSLGADNTRLAMLLAVCDKHAGISFSGMDIFINIVGGIKVNETAIDLALIAALVSSLRNQPLPKDLIMFGEVGLTGEIRPVAYGQERLKEAQKHGFSRAFIAAKNAPVRKNKTMQIQTVDSVAEFLDKLYA